VISLLEFLMKIFAGFLSLVGLILSSIVGYQLVQAVMPSLFPLWLASTLFIWCGLVANTVSRMEQ
jgi:hypothetical protein